MASSIHADEKPCRGQRPRSADGRNHFEYICKVESVNGTMRNIPVVTVTNVPPWGTLSLAAWTPLFAKTSVSQPSP